MLYFIIEKIINFFNNINDELEYIEIDELDIYIYI